VFFPTLKEFLVGSRFKDNEEMKDAVKQCLNTPTADVYDESMPYKSLRRL